MTLKLLLRGCSVGVMVAILSGCAWLDWRSRDHDVAFPEAQGLYAATSDGRLIRLDGDPQWETRTWGARSDLDSDTVFVIRHDHLGDSGAVGDATIELHRVAWVRSRIDADGRPHPPQGDAWRVSRLEQWMVPMQLERIDGRSDTVRAIPGGPLEPGLYALQLRTGDELVTSRLGVRWPQVDRAAYSASTCVDLHDGLDPPAYLPCADVQTGVADTRHGLEIILVDPQTSPDGGVIVVQGVIVNRSGRFQPVPPLLGAIRAADGRVLDNWHVQPPVSELGPGESTTFRSQVRNIPGEAYDVRVHLDATGHQ